MTVLPRMYWCHADVTPAAPYPLGNLTTTAPGEAVEWVREAVRGLICTLERETFHSVWGWLGDHRAVQAGIEALRRGEPYVFSVNTPVGRWTLTAYPVSVLPLRVADCTPDLAAARPPDPQPGVNGDGGVLAFGCTSTAAECGGPAPLRPRTARTVPTTLEVLAWPS